MQTLLPGEHPGGLGNLPVGHHHDGIAAVHRPAGAVEGLQLQSANRRAVKVLPACPDNLTGLLDRDLVLMHFAVAGRRHELAFNRVRDDAETSGGIQAGLRVSRVRPRIVPVPYGSRPSVCPVRAWHAWKEAAGLTDPDGYA
ncbi:hypothetical protein ACFC18_15780 [Streptomyces sp. NPDC056121]|uniref:hypothetical protein n=1 Tax=Streptomyces sp. NPDC056121 TaxID=3345718 RepID=UPI0035DFDDC0